MAKSTTILTWGARAGAIAAILGLLGLLGTMLGTMTYKGIGWAVKENIQPVIVKVDDHEAKLATLDASDKKAAIAVDKIGADVVEIKIAMARVETQVRDLAQLIRAEKSAAAEMTAKK